MEKCTIVHQLDFFYTKPVSDVVIILAILPRQIETQDFFSEVKLLGVDQTAIISTDKDRFGNTILKFLAGKILCKFNISILFTLRCLHEIYASESKQQRRCFSKNDKLYYSFLEPTLLTRPNKELIAVSKTFIFAHQKRTRELALKLCHFVYSEIKYASSVTNVTTTASAAWKKRKGVCQDFAHILISIYRSLNFQACYVSGYYVQQGPIMMHAWVEVYIDEDPHSNGEWLGVDPTHGCLTDQNYIRVAIGRDYADVKPVSGNFYGDCAGSVTSRISVMAPL